MRYVKMLVMGQKIKDRLSYFSAYTMVSDNMKDGLSNLHSVD